MKQKPAVLITGASSGIGEAAAKHFSGLGHDVVLAGRNKERLEKLASSLKTKTLVLAIDIRRGPEIEFMIHESLKAFPHLEIIINNAGVYDRHGFLETTEDMWAKLNETNLLAPIRIMRAVLPSLLKKKSGVIVNVASTAGLRPVSGVSAYSTTKAALIHLTQSLALEYAAQGIKFHCVCPGIVDTPIHGGKAKEMDSLHPMGRVGTSEEVARALYYLACESSWMTGVILPVDGGISLT